MAAMSFIEIAPDVFGWSDTCNVWVIRDGSAAILIDLGDGHMVRARQGADRTSLLAWSAA